MRFARFALPSVAVALVAVACSSSTADSPATTTPTDDGGTESSLPVTMPSQEAGATDAADASDGSTLTPGKCADTFGQKLTSGFGRLDGVIFAVQKPSDTQCVMPNSDHVVLQVLWDGGVYRMVVNVLSNGADPKVFYGAFPHALPAPAFAEGWHTDAPLDYVTTLGVHTTDAAWAQYEMNDVVAKLAAELVVGKQVAVYSTSDGKPDSTHLVHRNKTDKDGAIVVDPLATGGTPKMLLFHFPDQTF